MSFLSNYLSRARTLNDDMAKIQRKIADITKDEARASSKVADYASKAVRATSISQAQSYSREAERAQQDIARLVQKRADETSALAKKQDELAKLQVDISREQEKIAENQERMIKDLQRTTHDLLQKELNEVKSITPIKSSTEYHAFISHATEDKDEVVRPLAQALIDAGFKIWYDEMTLRLGDSLRRSIDNGLSKSRFGIVVLSPSFLSKNWPQYELDGLVAKEMAGGKVILPLWHRITKDEVIKFSPSLADKLALNTAMFTISQMANEIGAVLKE